MKLFKLLDQLEKSFISGRKFYNRSTPPIDAEA